MIAVVKKDFALKQLTLAASDSKWCEAFLAFLLSQALLLFISVLFFLSLFFLFNSYIPP